MTTENEVIYKAQGNGASDNMVHVTRADRFTSFNLDDHAVPTGREEDWRFTPMRRFRHLFDVATFAADDAPLRVSAPEGVLVTSAQRGDETIGSVLAPSDRTAAVAWNGFNEATVVTIPRNAVIDEPVMITVDSVEGAADAILNQTVEIDAHDAAQLTVVSVQEWADSTTHASHHRIAVGRDTQLRHIVVTLGGDLVRINAETDYRAPGGNITMLGLYFVDAGQHLEHRVFVDHSQPNCYSRVTYKGALQGKDAHSVWIGDCLIREAADGTDTYELNRNLVLTEGAKADSVPNLEIENGEIAGAGHASATGRFDDEQLFYLMSRGISEADARRLVVRGFFAELIEQIGVPAVQDHLMASIEAELRIFVDHSQPKTYSRVTYKGALQGNDAHSVWVGDVLIQEAADGTDTYELNRNLVLTEGAKADSVPNLEIENGEIEGAGHASATGRFDDEQLFYLMSRGISEMDARRLVVRGFFAELIDQIGVPAVQEHLMASIEAELERASAAQA